MFRNTASLAVIAILAAGCNADGIRPVEQTPDIGVAPDLAACSPNVEIRSVGPAEFATLVLATKTLVMTVFGSVNVTTWQSFDLDSTPRTPVQNSPAWGIRTASNYGSSDTKFVGSKFSEEFALFMFGENGIDQNTIYPVRVDSFYDNGLSGIAEDDGTASYQVVRVNADASVTVVRSYPPNMGSAGASVALPIGDSVVIENNWLELPSQRPRNSFLELKADGKIRVLSEMDNPDCPPNMSCLAIFHDGVRAFPTGVRPGDVSIWYVFRNDWDKPSYLWSFSLADPQGKTIPMPGTIRDMVRREGGGWVAVDNETLVSKMKGPLRLRVYDDKANELVGSGVIIDDIVPSEYGSQVHVAAIDRNHFVVVYISGAEGKVAFVDLGCP